MEINDIWYLPNKIKVSIAVAWYGLDLLKKKTLEQATFLPEHDKIVRASLSHILQVADKKHKSKHLYSHHQHWKVQEAQNENTDTSYLVYPCTTAHAKISDMSPSASIGEEYKDLCHNKIKDNTLYTVYIYTLKKFIGNKINQMSHAR